MTHAVDQCGEAADTKIARAAGVVVLAEEPRSLDIVGFTVHDRVDEVDHLIGAMLAVGVHRHDDVHTPIQRVRESGPDRVALAAVPVAWQLNERHAAGEEANRIQIQLLATLVKFGHGRLGDSYER